MEKSVAEYLVFLRENASAVKQEAKDLGLTEEEIKQCIEKVLSGNVIDSSLRNSPKNCVRICYNYFRVLMKIVVISTLAIITLGIGVYFFVEVHEPSAEYIAKNLQPYGYEIFRALRLVSLPLHSWTNITGVTIIKFFVGFIRNSISSKQCSKVIKVRAFLSWVCGFHHPKLH